MLIRLRMDRVDSHEKIMGIVNWKTRQIKRNTKFDKKKYRMNSKELN